MHHARREIQVLLCGNPKHILNDAGMERASPLASGEHIAHIQEEHFGLLAGNNVAKQLRDFALADSMKQRRVGKKKIFMKIILPLLQQHTRCFDYSIIRAENQEQGGKTYGKHSCKQENLDR